MLFLAPFSVTSPSLIYFPIFMGNYEMTNSGLNLLNTHFIHILKSEYVRVCITPHQWGLMNTENNTRPWGDVLLYLSCGTCTDCAVKV